MNLSSKLAFCRASVTWKSDSAHFSLILLGLQCFFPSPPTLTAPTPEAAHSVHPHAQTLAGLLSPSGKEWPSLSPPHRAPGTRRRAIRPVRPLPGSQGPSREGKRRAGGVLWLVCLQTRQGSLAQGWIMSDEYFWDRGSCLPPASPSQVQFPGFLQGRPAGGRALRVGAAHPPCFPPHVDRGVFWIQGLL